MKLLKETPRTRSARPPPARGRRGASGSGRETVWPRHGPRLRRARRRGGVWSAQIISIGHWPRRVVELRFGRVRDPYTVYGPQNMNHDPFYVASLYLSNHGFMRARARAPGDEHERNIIMDMPGRYRINYNYLVDANAPLRSVYEYRYTIHGDRARGQTGTARRTWRASMAPFGGASI